MKVAQAVLPALEGSPLNRLAADEPQLVLVFGPPEQFSAEMAARLSETFPGAVLTGCSTAGEITRGGLHDKQCVVTAVRFDKASVRAAMTPLENAADSRAAGGALGTALAAPDLACILLFSKGVEVNGTDLIDGLVEKVGAGIPITGGLAGDYGAFSGTAVLYPGGVSTRAAVAVGLYGDIVIGQGSFGGWQPFGPARLVTRATSNVLYELDGTPALELYKRYLGDYSQQLPASGLLFPFEVLDRNLGATGLIRTILGIDEDNGSLLLAGSVPEGAYMRLMHASTDALIEGAEEAGASAAAVDPSGPTLGLLISCVGRKLVMGDRVDEEIEAVSERLPPDCVMAGFYSYGEINPLSGGLSCMLHNQTMTVAVIAEH
jgi:hypothetical protein